MSTKKPKLTCIEGPCKGKSYVLSGVSVIGRVAEREVHVEDQAVSRSHAKVEVSPNGYVITDLGSANGTLVNGNPLQGTIPLRNGDVVQVGQTVLRFDFLTEERVLKELKAPPGRSKKASKGKSGLGIRLVAGVVGLLVVVLAVAMVAGKGGDETASEKALTQPQPEVRPEDLVDNVTPLPIGTMDDVGDLLRRADQLYEERGIALAGCWMALVRYNEALRILRQVEGHEELRHQTVAKLEAASAWLDNEFETRKRSIDRNLKQAQSLTGGPKFDLLIAESYRLADEITELVPDKMDERNNYGRKRKMTLGKYAKRR